MFSSPGSRLSPAEFSLRIDEAKARAAVLRQEAMRDFGSSLFAALGAAARRLVRSPAASRTARTPARPATHGAR